MMRRPPPVVNPASVHVRWMIRRDMPEVLTIEEYCDDPNSEEDLLAMLRERNCIGMVAEAGEKVVGQMIYFIHRQSLEIIRFGVHPDYRRGGVGASLMQRLVSKLNIHRRTLLAADVNERNVTTQMFLKAMGWEAWAVRRCAFGDDDGYRMRFQLQGVQP